ncbi:glucosamine-6-phosphate deaminase [bacterium]|nr:glucosamine-6-phosphate deaminase [bacterium]
MSTTSMKKKRAKSTVRTVVDAAKLSLVEKFYLEKSGRKALYGPAEKIPVIEVGNFPALGRLTALRFLEWVLDNPEGVISLPTGKTPEYFISWVKHYLRKWEGKSVQEELAQIGLTAPTRPRMDGLHFVQIDEFYPIDSSRHNSFHYYVTRHYLRDFGLNPDLAMLIDPGVIGVRPGEDLDTIFPGGRVDLSLRSRNPKSELEERQRDMIVSVDQFCCEYEDRIRQLGGLGFFLGGIGPDGHIGFNARGSDLFSPTRLTYTNYETEAAAAGDLGGIEVSRGRPVITIGLGTITYNPNAVALIFAAGEAKAKVVSDAVQRDRHVLYPATSLHGMPNARFYLTTGATVRLEERNLEDIMKAEAISDNLVEKHVIDCALKLKVRLDELKEGDEQGNRALSHLIDRTGKPLPELADYTRERLLQKINRGLEDVDNQSILHTGPHHDDIMLGYMPYIMHLVRRSTNSNYFYILTSGFTSVTNHFLANLLHDVQEFMAAGQFDEDQANGDLEPNNKSARAVEVFRFLDGIAARNEKMRRLAQARRTLVNLISVFEDEDFDNLAHRISETLNYLDTLYPGKKDVPIVQRLKGMQREYEEELVWAYVGAGPDRVFHGRLGFYTGDIFTEQPTRNRDVEPVLARLHKIKPSIVTLAFDPEGSGPDTHYKVLQVLHEALQIYHEQTGSSPKVWGYRNVWYRFHPADANVFVPASFNTMAIMEHAFMHCMGSQKAASFPSHEFDGPFCQLAQKLWVEQFGMLETCLGERFFIENPSPRLRATRGFVFLKMMELDEFSGQARRLATLTEGDK